MSAATPLLEVEDLKVCFGSGVHAKTVVDGIGFAMRAGEKFALVGESGSGKTLSALALLRLVADAAVTGSARFDGRDLLTVPLPELRAVRGRDIAVIFQEPMTALNPLFSIGQQIAEVVQLKQGLQPQAAMAAAVALLTRTGIAEAERRARSFPHQLSGGQRQRAMIAMALACQPRLLLADEPTTALDATVRAQILDLLADLQRQTGMAVLLITHDLNLVRRFADRVAVMEHGRIVEQGAVDVVLTQPREAYTKRLLASLPRRDVPAAHASAPVLVQARQLAVRYPVPVPGFAGWWRKGAFTAVHGADLVLRQGQTLGVMGESGSGKSSLAQAVLGLIACSGDLQVLGQSWQSTGRGSHTADRQLRRALQVVFQDPFSSLSPRMTVEELVGEGLRVHEPALDASARRERVRAALADVGLDESQYPGLLQRYPHEFSGGQRQRLAIARALVIGPRMLVLDEPTSALDVTIQQQVLQLLQRLQRERGLAYLLITHDAAVVRAMAHDVLVLKDGVVVESGAVDAVFDHPTHPYTRQLVADGALRAAAQDA